MTREQKFEKAVYDYSKKIEKGMNGIDYFNQENIELADSNPKSPWLNVEVDLPHKHDSLLIKCLPYNGELTKPVLALVDDGSYQVCDMFINEEGKWEWSYNGTVLYWMSIPKLEED